jgi:glycine cleavage system H protein
MSEVATPNNTESKNQIKYTKTHEWVRQEPNGEITVGITDHAQQKLGDLVFVELPEVGADVNAQSECVVVESVKAAADVYAPATGVVTEINTNLEDSPELVNEAAHTDGWLFKMKPTGSIFGSEWLSEDDYKKTTDDN